MRGGDGTGIRAYNQRLVVSAVLGAGALSKAEVARATGLSGQAARLIVDELVDAGVLRKLPKVKGQIGQPSTPVAVNPEGAFSLGLKIGRRSLEAVLVNLQGEVAMQAAERLAAPLPEQTLATLCTMAQGLLLQLPHAARARVGGCGIAMPGDLHEWPAEMGLPEAALEGWRALDAAAAVEAATGLKTEVINDGTAACAAEMIRGTGVLGASAVYFYIGAFAGGGLVIDGRLARGGRGNAGALGSMPMGARDSRGRPRQLLQMASAIHLERMFDAAGCGGPGCLHEATPARDPIFERWAAEAGPAIAHAAAAAMAVYDFETVIVDGVLAATWRRRLMLKVRASLARDFNLAGLSPAAVTTGDLGPAARVLGAALLPLHERYSPDAELVLRPR